MSQIVIRSSLPAAVAVDVSDAAIYGDEDEAARAYDVEARKLGRKVNFAVDEGEADDGGTGSSSKATGPSSKRSRGGQKTCSVCRERGHDKRTCKKKIGRAHV